jgi:general secretion pathway protein D
MKHKYLRAMLALFALILLIAGALEAKSKADKIFELGQAAEQKQDWDKALDLYIQALDMKPNDAQYTIAMRRARFQSGQKHLHAGQKLRTDGKLEEALGEFQRSLIADPSSSISIQEIKRTEEMINGQKKPGARPEDRGLTPAETVRRDTEERIASIMSPPELKPVLRTVGPLKMNNQPPKVLFETVGKLAGVNVLFDSQYTAPSRGFNVELNASTPEQAFDYLATLTHTFWKPISTNAIFIAEDNPTKHRDYDDEVVKTFYLTNATSVQEFQEVATAIRTVADIRRVTTFNPQKAMIIRGSLDAVALAEKLVHDLDKPKSEVIIDVIIMQANNERTKNLAATIASASGAGLSLPVSFVPQNGLQVPVGSGASGTSGAAGTTGGTGPIAAAGAITLGQLPHVSINDFQTSLPGALLNLIMTDTKTKIMNSPQLRASDGQKAELKIGERYPYATGSFQPGVGTVGVSPLVSTQFNYADVGVNIVITPQVHSAKEVTLHIDVEVSNIASTLNLGGISQPIIAQSKNSAEVRLRDGEVNILSGLSQVSDSKQVSGLPGLTNIPVLGGILFGSTNTDKTNNQLMIALIPHIIRTPDYSAENLRGIGAGNDQVVKLTYAPKPEPAAPTPPAEPAKPAAPGAAPQPVAPAPTGQARLGFSTARVQSAVGSAVTVMVQVENASDVYAGSPIKIKYDPAQLRLNDMTPGDLLARDGAAVSAVKDIRNDAGEATTTLTRPPGSSGVSGSGSIVVLNFVAVGKGTSSVTLNGSALKNAQGQPLDVTLASLPVTIQ